jgi:predicted ATPase
VTSFIGRQRELAELTLALDRTRILTLTGAGGVGKTRLALLLASQVVDRFADGVWLVELAPIADPTLIPQELTSCLRLQEQHGRPVLDAVVDHLRPRHALLVIDNCEHLIGRCAELIELLATSCPRLQILATSREPLGIAGETDWRVPSLRVPGRPGEGSPPWETAHNGGASVDGSVSISASSHEHEELVDCDAVRLFVDRASAALPSFRLTANNRAPVAEICARLDGIPLAIELAAVRVKAFSPEQIAARLDNLFGLLTGGKRTALARQQTLHAAVDWSYALLDEAERSLFGRLAVFAGGWTLEGAVDVAEATDEFEVLDVLTRLGDKSLVIAERTASGTTRYSMLETVRQYAQERLDESGAREVARTRHLDYYLALAEEGRPKLQGSEQGAWLSRFDLERENLLSAHAWCESAPGGAEKDLRLAYAAQ